MKLYAITLVKNEVDIIDYTLKVASEWADKIIVFDNGSNDGTWEAVNDLKSNQIIPFKQDSRPYSDGLRSEIFNGFRNEMQDGDWWFIQDSDEFYDINPRKFLESQDGFFQRINGKKIDLLISKEDTIEHRDDFTGSFESDKTLIKYYLQTAWSEPRAFMHRNRLKWDGSIWPEHMGVICKNTIPILHYPNRSPDQIKERWMIRQNVKNIGGQFFEHWNLDSWQDQLKSRNELFNMDQEAIDFDSIPLKNNFREKNAVYFVKYILHRIGFWP